MKRMIEKKLPGRGVYFEKKLLESLAYFKLTGTEIRVLNIFYLKRQLFDKKTAEKARLRQNSAESVRNNGKIIFRYSEAKKYGITKSTFSRAIDKLESVGFIDVSEPGGSGTPTKFAISDRWMEYGTSQFELKIRLKQKNQKIGFSTRFKRKICSNEN